MKVAIAIERIDAWRGGAETSTLEFAHLLAGRGIDVTVFTATRCPSPPDLRIELVATTLTPKPLRTARFAARAARRLAGRGFDIVHAVTPLPGADVYQPRGGLIGETVARNVALRGSAGGRLLKRVLARLNIKRHSLSELEGRLLRPGGPVIAAVSAYVARQVRERYGDGPRVRVIFNGVAVRPAHAAQRAAERNQIRAEYAVPPGALLLLAVAHNFKLKGIPALLDALAAAVRTGWRDVRLLVAGRDNPVPLITAAQRLGIGGWVQFVGPTERIAAFYHAADVCVHPTWYDPCSRVVLEALSRGVPCITTACNGASEVMVDGVHGYVIDRPDNTDVLADRLLRMRDAARRTEMGVAAAALAPRLSMQRHVDEMIELYRELIAQRGGAAGEVAQSAAVR